MKMKSFVIAISLFTSVSVFGQIHAKASSAVESYNRDAKNPVVVTKTMKYSAITPGKNEASNIWSKGGYIKKGSDIFVSKWIMSTGGGYIVWSQKYNSSNKFYFVKTSESNHWFRKFNSNDTKKFKQKIKQSQAAENKKASTKQKQFVSSHPIEEGKYQSTSDTNALNNAGFDDDSDSLTISENYAPTDSRAALPINFKFDNHAEWDVLKPNGIDTATSYTYLNDKSAKAVGYSHGGWVNDPTQSIELYTRKQ